MANQIYIDKTTITAHSVSLPKGGGAIKGIEETFQSDSFSGTGSFSIPIPLTSERDFEPQLSVDYNSGSGNGEFGLGFSLPLPKISIRTEKDIPKYLGGDVFTAGTHELVLKKKEPYKDPEGFDVYVYLPRVEGDFSLITHHVKDDKSESYWEVITCNNVKSFYGKSNDSRVYNPDNSTQIFEWLIDSSVDANGNEIVFQYKGENTDNIPTEIFEQNRSCSANRYIQSIKYGNYFEGEEIKYEFEIVFDYGEHDISDLDKGGKNPYNHVTKWTYRPDAFSSYKNGFEIRTCRLCRNILIFHHLEKELGDPCLVRSIGFEYSVPRQYGAATISGISMMKSVELTDYRRVGKDAAGRHDRQRMPKLDFKFTQFAPPEKTDFSKLEMTGNTIPGYLDHTEFLPVDLYGEGIPGFLYHDENSIMYLAPEGGSNYSAPASPDKFPIDSNPQSGMASLIDMGGNCKADMLLADDAELLGNPSKGRNGNESAVSGEKKEDDSPSVKRESRQELVTFADIFGDGLAHRVRITKDSVECWPNLGYGKFGGKITLKNAPHFDDNFDIKRLFLADIDGSGTMDLIYAYSDRVELFLNQNGNSFSDAIIIELPDQYGSIDRIDFLDINGNGTHCLVLTKTNPEPVHYFYDFVRANTLGKDTQIITKPYLLYEMDNNMGTVSLFSYASSISYYLADKKAGRPWLTKLPFPVQVVEKIITTDKISGARITHRFAYHDGYYDHVEREFRGFGYVESWDTETYADFKENCSGPIPSIQIVNETSHVPAVYTRTWCHTGAETIESNYKKAFPQKGVRAYDFPDSVFDTGVSNQDAECIRQAYAALKGLVMRTEVYTNVDTQNLDKPYAVSESNWEVKLYQERGKNEFAVFLVHPKESISYNYERNLDDPRVMQSFVMETDQFGNVLTSCEIMLPRMKDKNNGSTDYPQNQIQLKGTVSRSRFVEPLEVPDGNNFTWCHVPWEEKKLELSRLDLKGQAYFSFDEIKTQVVDIALKNIIYSKDEFRPNALHARLISWEKTFFWNEAPNRNKDILDEGKIGPNALVHHREKII